jgi:hypothetical protein
MIETIQFNNKDYPAIQAAGNAMQFAKPVFSLLTTPDMIGYDIGCNKEEWKFDGAVPIDPVLGKWSAMNLPHGEVDYIVSAHMLEHYVGRFQDVVEYWLTKIKKGGLIGLYLPNCDYQKYWAWGNKKHVHYLSPDIMQQYCEWIYSQDMITKFFVSEGYDANGSFYVLINK